MIKILKIFYWVFIGFIGVIAILLALSFFNIQGAPRAYVVQSGSMEPAIKTGSLVLVQPGSVYEIGEIITVKQTSDTSLPESRVAITHRIVEVLEENGQRFYVTKGDANNAPDFEKRPHEAVIGKVMLDIPYLGYPVDYAKTQTGFIVLIVIPATIIIYSEIITIRDEVKGKLIRRKEKKQADEDVLEAPPGE